VARDISERKHNELDLQRTTTLLNDAQRIANVGGWELDVQTGDTVWTDQVYAIHELPLGTPTNKIEGISFYHPDDQSIITTALNQTIEQQVSFDVQSRFITAKGNHRWVRAAGYPIVQNEQVTRIIGTFQDITAQKLLEERLRKSEQQLYSTLASMDDFVFVLDAEGAFQEAYSASLNDFYVPETMFLGKTYTEVLPPHVVSQLDNVIDQAKRATKTVFSLEYQLDEQGVTKWYNAKATARFDKYSHYEGLTMVVRDITERKQAEQALEQSEAKFRSFVENANDVIFTLNPQGEFVYISPMWKDVKGFSAEGLLGTSFVPLIHPEDINHAFAAITTIITSKTAFNNLVYRSKHGDGTWHWFSTNGAPIVDKDGNVLEILATTRDITNDKTAEQAMQATLKRLEQALANNTLLMKEVHHRVKNNLAVIASLLSLQAHELQDASAKAALRESRERVTAMAEIHELMYRHDNTKSIVFDEYLRALTSRMERSFSYKKQKVRFVLETIPLELPFDHAIPLALIVNELLTNATKYAFPQDHPDACVYISLATHENQLTLTVADNGVGLADDKVLETSDSLGMTVIHSLTDQLGGHINFTNHHKNDFTNNLNHDNLNSVLNNDDCDNNFGLQATLTMPLIQISNKS